MGQGRPSLQRGHSSLVGAGPTECTIRPYLRRGMGDLLPGGGRQVEGEKASVRGQGGAFGEAVFALCRRSASAAAALR